MAHGRAMSPPINNLTILAIDRGIEKHEPLESDPSDIRHFLFQVHGFILAVVFTLAMPVAVWVIRLGGKSAFSRHWIVQIAAVAVAIGGMSIALLISKKWIQIGDRHGTHKLIGIFVLCSLLVQPCIGYWHHLAFIKLKRRTSITFAHILFGRAIIILGWLNIAL
ncbi:predicted protein [Uncinocarpus reesii 1704]|uniref:Cytochrome b561 domain-containing protein n=1 Tax=Uncinocarpus reesii (strain UAMH 1704) TaxID=336963 RepID=C4JNM9_UNCRE|nr:uncharacterized protein UREG_03027 [Uncinocarpus reesii 1704]EEP78182.1 predicted protein [Uncinocarpus reesii 1704]